MPVVAAQYQPPPAKKPCCSACDPAKKRAAANMLGQAVAAAYRRRRGIGELGAEAEAEAEPWLWWTPGAIDAYVEKANTEIWSLAADYSAAIASGSIGQPQLQAFKLFFNEWETWRSGLNFFSSLTKATVDTAKNFRQRAAAWRDQLASSGAKISTPAPQVGDKGAAPSEFPTVVKWAAGAAIAVAGAVAVGHLATAAGLFKHSRARAA